MSATVPTIWMNVTTSANWQRPPVGIVRVERSLCFELAKLYGDQFKQCVWRDGEFVEWTPPPMAKQNMLPKHENHSAPTSLRPFELPPIFPLLSRRQALSAVAQGLLSLVPDRVRPGLNRLLYRIRPTMASFISSGWLTRIRSRARKTATSIVAQLSPVELPAVRAKIGVFKPGDVLISVGLDWNHKFYKEFYTLRNEQQVRIVTCCYDLIPVIYPQYCVGEVAGIFTSYFLDVADGSDLVLCISRQTEKDFLKLMERTGGAKPKTHVFPLGDNVPLVGTEQISPAVCEVCKEPFILFVSTIERRKNHEVLYRAYHLLSEEGKRDELPKLVFVGMQGWGVAELLKDIELDPLTRDHIIWLNHVSDAELRVLYDSAKFCVFPSLYEGWGLPVGEALALGKAVLCSDRGSLPEVGGDLVLYVDPWNPRAWADQLYRMATDEAWRTEWVQKARTHYRARTWAEAAQSINVAIGTMLKLVNSSSVDKKTHKQ